jgi:hypothetical protein
MKFYEIDSALLEAIKVGDKPLRVKMEIDVEGVTLIIPHTDILEAGFFALREVAGGTALRGEVLIDNSAGQYSVSHPKHGAGAEVRVYFFCWGRFDLVPPLYLFCQ